MANTKEGGITYNEVDQSYFDQRGLRRHAGIWSLWALGVGAVVSGDFFGWNFGLTAGGFVGLLIATVIITVMYICLCCCIAEMAPALPHTGGAYSFGRAAMGPWGGFVTGLGENMEYIITTAVIVVGIAGYMDSISGALLGFTLPGPIWWAIFYFIFVGLNVIGVEASFRFTVGITFVALAILVVFYIGAIPHFSTDNLFTVPASAGHGTILPEGILGIFWAMPFAIWFFLAIEELPLAAEEAHDPKRDLPRSTLLGLATLIVTAFLMLFLNAGIAPGADEVGKADNPLFLGFKTIFGGGMGASVLALIAVAGLVASFHTIIYAFGRNIYSLSRAGYFPRWLSVTHGERKTPHVALIAGAVIGYIASLLIWLTPSDSAVGAVLLNMAVFGAVISYLMQCLAFILLRRNLGHIERPFVSPLGVPGAVIAFVICAVTFLFLFLNPDYRFGVIGVLIWYVVGLIYFAVVGRHKLVRSPEEDFALSEQRKTRERKAGRT